MKHSTSKAHSVGATYEKVLEKKNARIRELEARLAEAEDQLAQYRAELGHDEPDEAA